MLAVGSAGIFGASTVFSKFALERFPPVTLLLVQLLGSLSALWLFVWLTKRSIPLRLEVWKRAATGVLEPGMTYLLGFLGLTMTSAGQASLVATLETVMILTLSAFLLKVRVERRLLGLALLATFGAVLVIGTAAVSNALSGNFLVLLGTACAALYVVFNQREILDLEPVVMVGLQQLVGLAAVLVVWGVILASGGRVVPRDLDPWGWGLAALLGVMQYALGFSFYFLAQRGMAANETAVYLTLIPVFGVVGGALFLGETLRHTQWLGAVVIVASIAFMAVSSQGNKSD